MNLRGYLLKSFKSPIVISHNDMGSPHVTRDPDLANQYGINTRVYPDGVVLITDPRKGSISLSIDNGYTWVNDLTPMNVTNIKRVDKETFVFDFENPDNSSSVYTAVTYDMFLTHNIITTPSEVDQSVKIKCKNEIVNRPYAFVGNALYSFNQELRSCRRIMTDLPEYCSLGDSIDGDSVYLLKPDDTSGYSMYKFSGEYENTDPISEVHDNEILYTTDGGLLWDGTVIAFNVMEFASNDAFTVTYSNFYTQTATPNIDDFTFTYLDKFMYVDQEITDSNCDSTRISIRSVGNKLFIFANIDVASYCCSIYELDMDGNLVDLNNYKDYSTGLYILDSDGSIETTNEPVSEDINYVSVIDNCFYITNEEATVRFNPYEKFSSIFINRRHSPGDIACETIGNIYFSKDIVSFRSNPKNVRGLNVSPNPINGFTKYDLSDMFNLFTVEETTSSVTLSELKGLTFDEGFVVSEYTKYATLKNLSDGSAEITYSYDDVIVNIPNTHIIGACFYGSDILYVKSKFKKGSSNDTITESNYHKISYPVLCSVDRGELIEFPIIKETKEKLLGENNEEENYIRFKNIKVVNGNLFLLFENYNALKVNKDLKTYKEIKNKKGYITSIDFCDNRYVVGVTNGLAITYMNDKIRTSGKFLLIGENLNELEYFDKLSVKDIVYDKYRSYLYILTDNDFRIYNSRIKLLKISKNNVFSCGLNNVNKKFLLESDYDDIRKLSSENFNQIDVLSFNDSVSIRDIKFISSSLDKNSYVVGSPTNYILYDNVDVLKHERLDRVPLFINNLNNVRDSNTFSIFSKDENTGFIVEFSYDKRLIVYYPGIYLRHESFYRDIDVSIDQLEVNSVNIKLVHDLVLLRFGLNWYIYKIDIENKTLIDVYNGTDLSDELVTSEYISFIKDENGIALIPNGYDKIYHCDPINMIITDKTINNYTGVTQVERFDNNNICLVSYSEPISDGLSLYENTSFVGILIENDTSYDIVPFESTIRFTYSTVRETPIMKVENGDKVKIIYNKSISISFDKYSIYGSNNIDVTDTVENKSLNYDKIQSKDPIISIDNESVKKSKYRNFIKYEDIADLTYNIPAERNVGIIRDFNSNTIYNIVRNIGGHFIISDKFTSRKRIDVSLKMGAFNVVNRLKTDLYDVNVDVSMDPRVSAYIENLPEEELDKLCTLIIEDDMNI